MMTQHDVTVRSYSPADHQDVCRLFYNGMVENGWPAYRSERRFQVPPDNVLLQENGSWRPAPAQPGPGRPPGPGLHLHSLHRMVPRHGAASAGGAPPGQLLPLLGLLQVG